MAVKVTVYGTANMRQIENARKTLDDLEKTVADTNTSVSAKMASVGSSMESAGGKMTDAGKSMSRNVTLPLVAIGAASVATAAEFETTMNSLQVNAGASGKEMEALSALALQMGADTVFSAGEAASAMLELSKGGLSTAAIEGGALQSALNLAATEGMNLADASTIVVQAMNTFGISAAGTGRVVDVLAAGAVASTAGVQDLAGGLKYVGSTAASLKVPIEDTVTALAAMNNAGIDATTAGTSLNQFMLRLIPTTTKAAREMDDLGLKFSDSTGKLLPMDQIIGKLQKSMQGMGDDAKAAALKTMFGVEGMRAANVLLADGTKGYNSLREAVTKQGVAQDMADARMKGTAGALEQMKGSVETAGIAIGQSLAPAVSQVAGFITELTNKFTALDPKFQTTIVTVGAVVAAIGPLLWAIGAMTSGIGSGLIALSKLPAVFAAVKGAFTALSTALAANPWILIATAVAAAAIVIITNWDTIKEKLLAAWEVIKTKAAEAWDWIKDKVSGVMSTITNLALNWTIAGRIIKHWDTIKDGALDAWNAVVSFFRNAPDRIVTAFGDAGSVLFSVGKNIVLGLWNGLSAMGSWLYNKITGWADGILDKVKGVFGVKSPSVEMAKIGGFMGEGLAIGLMDSLGGVARSATQFGKSTMSAIAGQLTPASAVLGVSAALVGATPAVAAPQSSARPTIIIQSGAVQVTVGSDAQVGETRDAMQQAFDDLVRALGAK